MPAVRRALFVLAPLVLAAAAACAGGEPEERATAASTATPDSGGGTRGGASGGGEEPRRAPVAVANLRTPDGMRVGQVSFSLEPGAMRVGVEIRGLADRPGFHALQVHANDDPSNGEGCEANPLAPPETWFVSADGLLSTEGQTPGDLQGDLPSVLVTDDGTASAEAVTDRFGVDDLAGTAVILHAEPGNHGNVPTGDGPEDYTANSPDAVRLTDETGNAGDRIACGVIEQGGGSVPSSA